MSKKELYKERNDAWLKDYLEGKSISEIAKDSDLSYQQVRTTLRRKCEKAGLPYLIRDERSLKSKKNKDYENNDIIVEIHMRPEQYEALRCVSKYYHIPKELLVRNALAEYYEKGDLLRRLWNENDEKFEKLAKMYPHLFFYENSIGERKYMNIEPFDTSLSSPDDLSIQMEDILEEYKDPVDFDDDELLEEI